MPMPTRRDEFITGLDRLRAEYPALAEQLDQSNDRLYDFLRRVQLRVQNLVKRPKLREKVVAKIGKRKNRNLTQAVLIYVTKAETKADRKKVSKYARALDYLADKETEITKIPEAIKKGGGIESLARKAAKELPKTKRSTPEKPAHKEARDEVAHATTESKANKHSKTTQAVSVAISPKLNQELSDVPFNEPVTLIGRRVEGEKDRIDIEITGVITGDDWE
jgi:hypothetical protein